MLEGFIKLNGKVERISRTFGQKCLRGIAFPSSLGFAHRKRRPGPVKKEDFYLKPSDASRVKQAIVATYFGAWKKVLKTWRNKPQLGYVDLYSGPGIYEDGSFTRHRAPSKHAEGLRTLRFRNSDQPCTKSSYFIVC